VCRSASHGHDLPDPDERLGAPIDDLGFRRQPLVHGNGGQKDR
jgi:hypothetical protein